MVTASPAWYTYILITTDGKFTYVGATNNFQRRFRQHCGEIANGAKYTTNLAKAGYVWKPMMVIGGLTQRQALQFEIYQKSRMSKFRKAQLDKDTKKHISKVQSHARIRNLLETMHMQRWADETVLFDVNCSADVSHETWCHAAPSNVVFRAEL